MKAIFMRWEIELKLLAAMILFGLMCSLMGCDGITIGVDRELSVVPAVDVFPDEFSDDVDIDKMRERRRKMENRNHTIDVLVWVDEYRNEHGKKKMSLAIEMMEKAQTWAEEMASRGVCYHSPWPAENVAAGQASGEEVVNAWKDSRGHRANMLGEFEFYGAGCATGSNGVKYWVLMFR